MDGNHADQAPAACAGCRHECDPLSGVVQAYDQIQVLTSGGPAGATTTIALQIYNTGFSSNRTGYATAQSIILFLIISAITAAVYLFQGRKDASNA